MKKILHFDLARNQELASLARPTHDELRQDLRQDSRQHLMQAGPTEDEAPAPVPVRGPAADTCPEWCTGCHCDVYGRADACVHCESHRGSFKTLEGATLGVDYARGRDRGSQFEVKPKKCTCGAESVTGAHSSRCDKEQA